jgi:hypothetical protein
MPIIPALGRLRQEDLKFEISLKHRKLHRKTLCQKDKR